MTDDAAVEDEVWGPLAPVVELPVGRQFDRNRDKAEMDELAPVQVSPSPARACSHRGAYISIRARRVYCRSCEAELDPYDVLDEIARNREFMVSTAQRMRYEIDGLRKQIDKLERLERNAKARVKRARDWLKQHAGDTWADLHSDDDLFRSDLALSGTPDDHRHDDPF